MTRTDPFHSATATVLEPEPVGRVTPCAPLPVQTPAPAAPRKGLKKLNFGATPAKKEDTQTAYPVFANAAAALIAARIQDRTAQLEALEGALATDKAELKQTVGLFYFSVNHGKHEIPGSISVPSENGEVLVSFTNRYKTTTEDALLAVLGEARTAQYFRSQDTLTIDCDQLPAANAQEFVDELLQLVARHHAAGALTTKSAIKPVAGFHTARHTVLTVAENLALEEACPIVTMVKTKGRKGN